MKNAVCTVRSVIIMYMPPTRTGAASTIRNAVATIDQTKIGSLLQRMPGARQQITVTMMLKPARISESPIRPNATA